MCNIIHIEILVVFMMEDPELPADKMVIMRLAMERGYDPYPYFANKNLSYYTTSAVLPATEPLSGTPGFPQCTLCRFLRCLSENLTFLYTASVRISDHSKQLYPSIGQFTL